MDKLSEKKDRKYEGKVNETSKLLSSNYHLTGCSPTYSLVVSRYASLYLYFLKCSEISVTK